MEQQVISKHKKRIRLNTVIPIVVIGLVFVACMAGVGAYLSLLVAGRPISWFDGFLLMAAIFIASLTGIMMLRFFARMLAVREVILFKNDKIGIVTWGKNMLIANLPADIEHMLTIGNDVTATLRLEGRRFVVDVDQFSDKDGINDFLRRFLECYRIRG